MLEQVPTRVLSRLRLSTYLPSGCLGLFLFAASRDDLFEHPFGRNRIEGLCVTDSRTACVNSRSPPNFVSETAESR